MPQWHFEKSLKLRIYKTLIKAILYSAETWRETNKLKKNVEAP